LKLTKNKVYITDYVSNPDLEADVLGDSLCSNQSESIEVLLVWHQRIDKDYLNRFPNLTGVVRYGVGYDNIDLVEIKKRGLFFCNTPDYGTDEVSDTVLAMILSLLRGIISYDKFSRGYTNSWQENIIPSLRRLSQQTLGVIGAGRIGTALMRKARVLGLNIIFYDPYKDSGYEKSIGVGRCYDLKELLSASDVVSIHTPLTEETRSMIDADFISAMKSGAILINSSRGEVLKNLDLLYDALCEDKLSAIALDVLPDEPPKDCKLIEAWRNHNNNLSHRIIINPHTSYYSQESYIEMRTKAATNALRILNGDRPLNIIIDRKI